MGVVSHVPARGNPLVFLATPDTVRSPCYRQEPTQLSSQVRHRQTIAALGKHWEEFHNQDNLALKIFIVLTRHGVLTPGDPRAATQQVLGAARQGISAIVAAIGQRIKKPDPRAVPAGVSSNVDVLSHAYHIVAREYGLSSQALVQLLDERHAITHAAAEEQRTPEAFCDLALTQIALGNYEEAIRTATEAAQTAEHALQPAAPDAEQRREAALNSWLLVADAARAARHPDQAIAAKERGGRLIDRGREPLFWAEYHEPLAQLLLEVGRYDDAERYIRAIIAIREEHLGENHLKLAEALLVLCDLLFTRANYLGVEVVAERILRILDGFPPEDTAGLFSSGLRLLGSALRLEGRYDEAEPALRQALAVAEKSFGPNHPQVGTALNSLALLCKTTQRLAEAEMLLIRALAIEEPIFGPDHPNVAHVLNNLGQVFEKTNRFGEAELLFRRALAIDEQSYGPDHPEVAKRLDNLAHLLLATRRLGEAELLYRRALAILEKDLGSDHPAVALVINNLSAVLRATNNLPEAESLLKRAVALGEKTLRPDHPDLAIRLSSLASLLQSSGHLEDAEAAGRRSLEILFSFTCSTKQPHPQLMSGITSYTNLLSQMGRSQAEVQAQLNAIGKPFGIQFGGGS